jgi:TRAP-type transport system periplasmic protein
MKLKGVLLSLFVVATTGLVHGSALAQAVTERTIRFGHLNNPDHPVSLGVKKFAEIVAAKSGGKMKVQEFPASQLGNEMQQQSALRGGVQEMTAPATTSLAGIVKEFGLLDLPFTVSTFQEADALLEGEVGKRLLAKLPEKGLVGLAYWNLGFRNVTNSKRPIAKPEDRQACHGPFFRGLRPGNGQDFHVRSGSDSEPEMTPRFAEAEPRRAR